MESNPRVAQTALIEAAERVKQLSILVSGVKRKQLFSGCGSKQHGGQFDATISWDLIENSSPVSVILFRHDDFNVNILMYRSHIHMQ